MTTQTQPPIISLRQVIHRYPHSGQNAALAGLTLDIGPGEFVAVAGANGSGKSTLARLLNGLLLPAAGEVLVDGASTARAENLDRIRETVGMVFQNPDSQIVAGSVGDDIAFGLENLGLPPDEIERRLRAAAERFGVGELLEKEPHWLSGGQKQRTVLAGVVAMAPRVLVLDEPTSMLDPRSQLEFHDLVRSLWHAGTTVVYVTHLMEEVAVAPRMLALADGALAFDGAPRDFFTRDDLLKKTGLVPPLAMRLSRALAAAGGPQEPALTLEELVERVCA
ncbi:MAG: ATP-binding cassette domain-containing protein [Actinomycetota bacterium]|nr:ATP-binding cassette domain-containing protein [Actinomycetota bacterium]MCL6092877.1 ATP-binding cassette domain-containing protein [Actinomycetota bacterium]MDA8166447.1 ATP-binding cassette domain-containing protein [Actinomycetota bacterium]